MSPQFFVPEDFPKEMMQGMYAIQVNAAHHANLKLEREGQVVYSYWRDTKGPWSSDFEIPPDTHKALLINIEPIEKCQHPREKVKLADFSVFGNGDFGFMCDCGARVEPDGFKVK